MANNKSYMGVTLHWINRDTLKPNKAALACMRLRGKHTFDVIVSELEQIHLSYGLLNKVVATVTYPISSRRTVTSESDEEDEQEDVTFTDVTAALCTENNDGQLTLHPH